MNDLWLVGCLIALAIVIAAWKLPAPSVPSAPTPLIGEHGPERLIPTAELRRRATRYACSCAIAPLWWRPTANPLHGGAYCQNSGRVFGPLQAIPTGPRLLYDDGRRYVGLPIGSGAFIPTAIVDRPHG